MSVKVVIQALWAISWSFGKMVQKRYVRGRSEDMAGEDRSVLCTMFEQLASPRRAEKAGRAVLCRLELWADRERRLVVLLSGQKNEGLGGGYTVMSKTWWHDEQKARGFGQVCSGLVWMNLWLGKLLVSQAQVCGITCDGQSL